MFILYIFYHPSPICPPTHQEPNRLSTYPSIYLPIHGLYLPTHQKPNHPFIYLPTYSTIYSPIQTTHIPIHLPSHSPIYLSTNPCVYPPIHLSTIHQSTYLSMFSTQPLIHLPRHPLPSAHPSPTHLPFYLLIHEHPSFSVLPLAHLVTHFL